MTKKKNSEHPDAFWQIRAAKYDKLFWTKDADYLSEIVRLGDLNAHHIVLDVGTGTGAIKNVVKDHVRHVVAIDSSDTMLKQGDWTGTSVIKWDIGESLFKDSIFDRVFARMVFHHIIENLDRAILRCYDLLKTNGKICVAEGVPPTDDLEMVNWYTDMFRYKEDRRTFTPTLLIEFLKKNGFKNIRSHDYYMDNFSIVNWVENSGLEKEVQKKIIDIHVNAPPKIKQAYKMRISENDCIIRSKNTIVVGEKL